MEKMSDGTTGPEKESLEEWALGHSLQEKDAGIPTPTSVVGICLQRALRRGNWKWKGGKTEGRDSVLKAISGFNCASC